MNRPDFSRVQRTVDLNGEIHLWDFGGSKPPIVLIHGLGGSRASWSAVAGSFTDLGRVVVPDLIGFGDTPPRSRSSDVWRQRELVIDLIEYLSAGPAVLIGNSMGGLIAMLVAAQRPDLVERLVLVGAAAPSARPHFRPGALLRLGAPLVPGLGSALVRWYVQRGDVETTLDRSFEFVMADPSRLADADRSIALETASRRRTMPWAVDAFRDAARSIARALIPPQRLARELARIEAPTIVIQGEADRVVPPATAAWLVSCRNEWDLRMLPGVGHVPQLEVAEEFTALITAWLAEGLASPPAASSA